MVHSTCKIAAAYHSSSLEQVRDVNPLLISSAFHAESFLSVEGLKVPFGTYDSKIFLKLNFSAP